MKEEFGSFSKQYDIAEICVKEAENMLLNGVNTKEINLPFDNDLKIVKITIIPGSYYMRFVTVNPDYDSIVIEIGKLNLRDSDTRKKLVSSISHEIIHGNVNLKIYHSTHKNALIDIPDYYDKLFDVMDNYPGKVAYYFAYGIYSTYFQEKNAFISQVSCEILDNFYNGDKKITLSDFKKLYAKTNSVLSYKTNIDIMNKINTNSDGFINSFIVKPFKTCGIDITINDARAKIKNILKYSEIALKDCRRNAMIAYNKINEIGGFYE